MRIRAIGQGVLGTTFVATIGFVGIFIFNLISWLVERTQGQSFETVLETSSRIWLNAHFVPIHIEAGKVAGITSPAYVLSFVPLGFAALIGWAIFRAGRRLAEQENLGWSIVSAIGSYLLLSVGMVAASFSKQIHVLDWQGVFLPTLLFSILIFTGALTGEVENEGEFRFKLKRIIQTRFEKLPWAIKPLLSPALRAGTGVVAVMAALSAISIALLLAINWVDALRLFQSLQLSFFGTLTVSLGQLAILPNAIIYGMSWLTGVGFQLGAGSMVSPLATELGPVPGLPLLAALPLTSNSLTIVVVLIPILAAFGATLLVKSHTADLRFNYASALGAAIALGVAIGLVAAIELAVLAWLASGGIGPERMSEVGVNSLFIFALSFLEVAVASTLAAFFSAKPEGVDNEVVQRVRRLK